MSAYQQFQSTDRPRPDGRGHEAAGEVPLGDLLRQFAQDATNLIRHEVALARLELRENLKTYARDAARLGVAAGVALFGTLAFMAALVIGLGSLIGNYWLSALIVAFVLLAAAGLLARAALAHLKQHNVAPEATIASLEHDRQWAKHEVQEIKRRLQA